MVKKISKKKNRPWYGRWQLWAVLAVVVGVLACGAVWFLGVCNAAYRGEAVRVYIPDGSSQDAIADTLAANLGADYARKVMTIWRMRDGQPGKAVGSYVVTDGMTAVEAGRKLLLGAQDPVKVTFNNIRTMRQLAERIAGSLELTPDDFLAACDSVLSQRDYAPAEYPAAFLPDTYEFYWNAKPAYVVKRLTDVRDKFWTPERTAAAARLGLTPAQAATVASIVEEESNKLDERPMIARLYLNRLHRHMRLQADPTVKFAVGDFSLRRITGQHLGTDSPYNTYQHDGLPPGPIRVVERATIDAVLNAPQHDYLYMCAKEDFSGYHNFATTGAEHMANARLYHQALNRRGIR